MKEKLEMQRLQISQLQEKHRRKVFKRMSHDNGVNVPAQTSKFLFEDEHKANVTNFLDAELGKDSIAAYVYAESCRKHKIAEQIGRNQVRHCPLTIRLGILIRAKMGYSGGLYDLLAKIIGIPTNSNLQQYTIPTSNEEDGILVGNIMKAMSDFEQANPGADRFAWQRHCTLAFDSMKCKGQFLVNYHTNEIVGIGHDTLKPDVILNELKELEALNKTDEQIETDAQGEPKEPPMPQLAKNFLIFTATT